MPDLIVRDRHGKEWPIKLWCMPTHYYSPIPDTSRLAQPAERARVWPDEPHAMPGIDWRPEAQVQLCSEVFARQEAMQFPDVSPAGRPEYARDSPRYPAIDAWVLQAMLRHLEPARVVEIGAGYSSLVTARVNREYLGGKADFTAIDPYPLDFLESGVPGLDAAAQGAGAAHAVRGLRAARAERRAVHRHVACGEDRRRRTVDLQPDPAAPAAGGGRAPARQLPPLGLSRALGARGKGWNELYLMQSFLVWNSAFEVLFGTVLDDPPPLGRAAARLPGNDRRGPPRQLVAVDPTRLGARGRRRARAAARARARCA